MTVESGPGCSVRATAVLQAHAVVTSTPGGLAFSGGGGGLQLIEDVERAGQQPAGDRHGGDLLAPAAGQLGVGGANMGLRLAVWAASWRIQRTHGEPCLVMWPWRRVRSELPT